MQRAVLEVFVIPLGFTHFVSQAPTESSRRAPGDFFTSLSLDVNILILFIFNSEVPPMHVPLVSRDFTVPMQVLCAVHYLNIVKCIISKRSLRF